VRAAAATTGAFAFEQLPLDAVERIEIVRGPRASYWGSDALGGVIQIFTRKLEGPRVALSYGSYRDADGSAGIGHWDGTNGYSVQVGARHVGGFSATNPGICNGPDDPYCSYNPDDDAYRNNNLVLRGAHELGSQLLSASLYRSQGQSQFDQGYTDIIEQTEGVNLEGPLGTNWSHRLSLGHTREDLDTPTFGTTYLTRRTSLLWQNEFRLDANQRLVAGFDFVHDKGETLDAFAGVPRYRDSRHDSALFVGWRATFGAFDSEVSARHDDNSAFGGATTGSLALGWRANELVRVYASFGQGFRSPTMNELAQRVKDRMALNASGVSATIEPGAMLTVRVTNGATIPITGLCTPSAESYGGQRISYLPVAAGQPVTVSLTACAAGGDDQPGGGEGAIGHVTTTGSVTATPRDSGGCSVSGHRPGVGVALVGLALALWGRRRRRPAG